MSSNNNNLRDQFPGMSALDRLLSLAFNIVEALAWLYIFVVMLSGWYRLFNLRDKSKWGYQGLAWGAGVLLLYIILAVLGLIILIATHWNVNTQYDQQLSTTYETTFNITVLYPLIGILYGIAIGAALLPITWILNKVVQVRDTIKDNRTYNKSSNERKFAEAQGWKIK
mgnify:CR=1 FL=1